MQHSKFIPFALALSFAVGAGGCDHDDPSIELLDEASFSPGGRDLALEDQETLTNVVAGAEEWLEDEEEAWASVDELTTPPVEGHCGLSVEKKDEKGDCCHFYYRRWCYSGAPSCGVGCGPWEVYWVYCPATCE